MKLIGIAFTKISGERKERFTSSYSRNNSVEFPNVEKEENSAVKDEITLKISFTHSQTYTLNGKKDSKVDGELNFEGYLYISASKDESDDIIKNFNKKDLSDELKLLRIKLINAVLQRCFAKSISLEEDLELPHQFSPRIVPAKKDEK